MVGTHLIKSWSSTQASIALSSGEAEFNGVVRGAGIGLGYGSILRDLGYDVPVRIWTDSSAAIGICSRQGLGKLRHIDTQALWVQERVRTGAIELRKVHGDVNPADLFTKHLSSRDRITQLVQLFNCEYRDGRAESAPLLRKDKTTTAQGGGTAATVTQVDNRGPTKTHAGTAQTHKHDHNDEPEHFVILSVDGDEVIEQEPHDPTVLPHEFDEKEMDLWFPKATAPLLDDEGRPPSCICSRPECRECFPPVLDHGEANAESW